MVFSYCSIVWTQLTQKSDIVTPKNLFLANSKCFVPSGWVNNLCLPNVKVHIFLELQA